MKIFFLICFVFSRTQAILINTSKSFFNYRHMTNLKIIYHFLVKHGISSKNILPIYQEDPHQNVRNTVRDKIFLNDSDYLDNMEFDAPSANLNEHFILNIIKLKHQFLIDLDERDNVIIYMCGHGREGFFKVNDRYFIFKNDLMKAFTVLSKRVSKAIIILDTCQASTIIETNNLPSNIAVITTSYKEEFSYSTQISRTIGVFGVDDFAYNIFKYDEGINISIKEFFEKLSKNLSSTIKIWGDSSIVLSDFLKHDQTYEEPLKEFIL